MGAEIFGGPLAVTSTAQNITTLLGLAQKKYLSTLVLRAAVGNTAIVWFGKSNVAVGANQLGFLQAGEALTVDIAAFTNTDEIFLVAASAQTVYATAVV